MVVRSICDISSEIPAAPVAACRVTGEAHETVLYRCQVSTGVSEDSSLTEFIGADGDDARQKQSDQTATITYAWGDQGAECTACGETVTRRWISDDELVCVACKSW